MVLAVFFLVLVVTCTSLFGWGAMVGRLAGYSERNPAVTLMIGLGSFIYLGGMLNLLGIAYGWVFDGVILAGLVMAAFSTRDLKRLLPRTREEWVCVITTGLLVSLIIGSTVSTQLPPSAYNYHDDFEKYFAYPVRMLQTGTLYGSPLNAIGLQTLGGQALLHGMLINHLPIVYINGVDAVFGLFLCLILPLSLVPRRMSFLPLSLLGLLVVFFIHPQYVNVSALYIASAFIMASIMLISSNRGISHKERSWFASPMLLGLVYAAIFSLKTNLPVFSAIQGVLFCVVAASCGASIRQLARWGISTVGFLFLFLSPWLLLHLPSYLHSSDASILHEIPASHKVNSDLLSSEPLFYGSSYAHYTLLALVAGIAGVAVFLWKRREHVLPRDANLAGLAASALAGIIAYLFFLEMGPRLGSSEANLRYAVPSLIATAPVILTLSCLWVLNDNPGRFKTPIVTLLMLFELLIVAGFAPALVQRVRQAFDSGNILAFKALATSPEHLAYNEQVLYGGVKQRIGSAQDVIPPGKSFMAWVTTPFYFDYRRNIIYDVNPAGIAAPWAHIPQDAEYYMFEYTGFAVRPIAEYVDKLRYPARRESSQAVLQFLQTTDLLYRNAQVLHNDGKIVVLKTNESE